MARRLDSLENLLSCQVCFEEFEEDGDRVPRILPCHHTLCQTCIAVMIARSLQNEIECPECRAIHEAKNGTRSFPQNKYLVIQARRKAAPQQEAPKPVYLCPEHGKELSLFCKEPGCQKPICSRCLTKHLRHPVVDIEESKEVLLRNVNSMKIDLREKIAKVSSVKEEFVKKREVCITKLKKNKEEINKQFDKVIKEVEEQFKEVNARVDDEVMAMNENLILLDSVEQNVEENTNEDVMDKLETVKVLSESVKQHLSGPRTYVYPEYEENIITQKELQINLVAETLAEQLDLSSTPPKTRRNITDASQLNCTVNWSVNIGFDQFGPMTLLPDGHVAVYGEENNEWKLKVYDETTGRELSCVRLEYEPCGITAVTLGGRATLALSGWYQPKIEFRDVTDHNKIVRTYSVAPHEPYALCTAGPSTLLYEDRSPNPPEVRWLDCSAAEPNPVVGKNVICTEPNPIYDMCCVQSGDKQLLVTIAWGEGVHAYNTTTGRLEWSVKGALPGMKKELCAESVTSDGHGHLFVCDCYNSYLQTGNDCIHLFSVDGKYLGVVLREGEQGLGNPVGIRWSETTSSLVVSHVKDDKFFMSAVNVQ